MTSNSNPFKVGDRVRVKGASDPRLRGSVAAVHRNRVAVVFHISSNMVCEEASKFELVPGLTLDEWRNIYSTPVHWHRAYASRRLANEAAARDANDRIALLHITRVGDGPVEVEVIQGDDL